MRCCVWRTFVILTPFCKIDTGNASEGAEVSHRRKSGDDLVFGKSSQIFSSVGIHETDK